MRQNYYHEKAIVRKLVAQAVSNDFSIVVTSEYDTSEPSQSFNDIWADVEQGDDVDLLIFNNHGVFQGRVLLIGGLGNELLADNSTRYEMFLSDAKALSDKLSDI